MAKSNTLNSFCKRQKEPKLHLYVNKLVRSFILFLVLVLGETVSAQTGYYTTVGQSKLVCTSGTAACPANDLQVKDIFIEGIGECLNCTSGNNVTADLWMVIDNTTGSVRTAFALFGTLSTGASINGISGKVFICVGPINITKGLNKFKVGQLTFVCGQQVTLTDNYLAYTPANSTTQDACTKFSQATTCKDISPKCGVSSSITIRTPVTAAAETVNDPCKNSTTADGSIKITPSAGTAPYSVTVCTKGTGDCPETPSGTPVFSQTGVTAAVTATALAAGTYCIYVTDANGCKYPVFTHTIGKDCCTPPAAPTVCQVPADLCGDGKVVLKISGTVKDAVYHVKQNNLEVTGSPLTASDNNAELTFKVIPGGGDIEVYGVTTLNGTTCTGESTKSDCKNDPTSIPTCTSGVAGLVNNNRLGTTEVEANIQSTTPTKVVAAPNPFNDRIRFSLQSAVSGKGSLELYNMLGQKVKVLYEGYIEKGVIKSLDFSVPGHQRSNLIYVFRVGDQKVSGKLIGLR